MSKEELEAKQKEYVEMMERMLQEQQNKNLGMEGINFKERIKYKLEEFIIKDREKTRQALLALTEELKGL